MTSSGSFTTDATTFDYFTSQGLDIAGVVYDPNDSAVIVSTVSGYEFYAAAPPNAKLGTMSGSPAENFGYNPANNTIWSPFYGSPSGAGLEYGIVKLSAGGGTLYTLSGGPTVSTPDSGAIDTTTGIAFSTEEFATQWYLVNLNAATTSGSTFTAPSLTLVPTGLDPNVNTGSVAGLTDSAITGHLVWIAGEFTEGEPGLPTMCALALPSAPSSGAPVPGDYACANFPTMPNAAPFNAPGDPHGVAAFDLGSEHYGLIFDVTYTYVAVVDMGKLLAEPRESGFAHTVDPTRNLVTDGVLNYVQI
jgi:hypothetical protein